MSDPNVLGGLAGGALIGLASALMWLLIGRITGISGILGGALNIESRQDLPWRGAFLAGLVIGAFIYRLLAGGLPLQIQAQGTVLVAAGLLVGVGTRVGAGCTSGHGVCGIARLSRRSFVATLTFVGVAMLTVFVTRHSLS